MNTNEAMELTTHLSPETIGMWVLCCAEKALSNGVGRQGGPCDMQSLFRNLGLDLLGIVTGDMERRSKLLGFGDAETHRERLDQLKAFVSRSESSGDETPEPETKAAAEAAGVWEEQDNNCSLLTATFGEVLVGVFPIPRYVRLSFDGGTIRLDDHQIDDAIAGLQAAQAKLAQRGEGE